jgi:hypothetical protein
LDESDTPLGNDPEIILKVVKGSLVKKLNIIGLDAGKLKI